jgi:DNA polymerase-3 subunit epsilon
MGKRFYFDVETTGLDPKENDIIQLAYIIEIDEKIEKSGDITMQPFNYETVSDEALQVHGRTLEEIKTYKKPETSYLELLGILSKYIDKYDKTDKFQPAGYNVRFDLDFLKEFFIKNGDKYFGSFFNYKTIDPLQILYFLDGIGRIKPLENYKLITVCEYFEIEIKAHDALSDIRATKELIEKLTETIHTTFED